MSDIDSVKSVDLVPKSNDDKKCAPALDFEDGSCMPLDVLIQLAGAYNEAIDTEKVSGDKISTNDALDTLNPQKYKRHLVKSFRDRLDSICDDQQCWINQTFARLANDALLDYIKNKVWRPSGPQGKFEWLNTLHIKNVMDQYVDKHPEFEFFGVFPIDFDDLNTTVANADFKTLQKGGKTKLGAVFNLDEHWKSGSHWVASFADLERGQVYFFDSYGQRPDPRIRKYMRRVARHISQTGGKKLDVRHNNVRHQFKNSECGVYSINFIERMLEGDTFDQIVNDRTKDEVINRFRDKYFIIKDQK